MANAETRDMAAGLLVAAGGGFAWLVVLGRVVGSPNASGLAVLMGLAGFVGGMTLFRAMREPRPMVIGLALIWVSLLNVIFFKLFFDRIPETIGGAATGKGSWGTFSLTVLMISRVGSGATAEAAHAPCPGGGATTRSSRRPGGSSPGTRSSPPA